MSSPVYALIDCNNFFVSCLRVFQPNLEGKPVVALSSNDGCVVARSQEARALNIPMGAPAFKWKQFFKDNHVIQMSGNFELYGDMSRRITALLTSITPHIEIYSVDESFLDLSELEIDDYTAWAREVKRRILQYTGIPVSIGIATSKTLAKLGAERAKKTPELGGVLDLATGDREQREPYLSQTPLQDVWGIGWRLSPKLRAEGFLTAQDVATMRPQYAQRMMGIRGRQVVAELNGTSCFALEKYAKLPKSIAITRTFGSDSSNIETLESALTVFASRAAYKLRLSGQLACRVGFFMTTSRHKPGYSVTSELIQLTVPTADTGQIIDVVMAEMHRHFKPRLAYHRAGVWLQEFIPESSLQTDLLGTLDIKQYNRATDRMQAVDGLNKRYGRHTVYYASERLNQAWEPRKHINTPRYTTKWDELPKVRPLPEHSVKNYSLLLGADSRKLGT